MLCYRKPSVFVSGPMFVVFAVLLYLTPLISELFINFQAIFIILLFVIFCFSFATSRLYIVVMLDFTSVFVWMSMITTCTI